MTAPLTAGATATVTYKQHVLHGQVVRIVQVRADLTHNGLALGPLVHVEAVQGRVTGGFWLAPDKLLPAGAARAAA